jgi:SAM-dependent methyltransferase
MLLLVVVAAAVWLLRRFSPQIYDFVIVKMTSLWYREVLTRLPQGARVLDIGIGTGTSLCVNASLVASKKLTVVGVDYDAAYVQHCARALAQAGLEGSCRVVCKSVFDADLAAEVGRDYDAVYFSGSISLMPTPHKALQVAAGLLRPGGKVYVTQTFQRKSFPLLGAVKPLLRYLTTIDFGQLTFERDVDAIVAQSGLVLAEKSLIRGSVDNQWQAAFVLVLTK